MKKNLLKVFTTASIVVAIILIMVLLVATFGGIDAEEFTGELAQGLLITLSIIYIVLAIISLVLAFINADVVKEVTVRTEQGGSIRVSSNVVTKFVKKATNEIEGVKSKKVSIVVDDYGTRLKVDLKVVDRDVLETETYVRTLLEDLFLGEFGFKFHSIELKIMSLAPKYKADEAAINERVAKKLEEIKAETEKEETAEEAKEEPVEEAVETPVEEVVEETAEEQATEEKVEEVVAEEAPVENAEVEVEAEVEAEVIENNEEIESTKVEE